MNTLDSVPTPSCARAAPQLPLLDDPTAATDSWVREHADSCAYCQARRAQYRRLDQALRDHYGFTSVRPRSTEEIMQHIDDPIETPDQYPDRTASSEPRRIPTRRSFLPGLGAVASVLLLIGLAAVLLGGHLRSGPGASGPPQYSFPGVQGLFADVSMVSPTEGWALAQVTKTPQGDRSLDEVTFYHYLNGAWTPITVKTSKDFSDGGISGFNGSIAMDSTTDGWAVAHNFNRFSSVFHYAGGTWTEAPTAGLYIDTLQALSPTSVWAISGSAGSESNQQSGIVHYDGSTWSLQSIEGLPVGSRPWFSGLRMISDSDGWALAALGNDQSTYAVLRLHAGNWTVHSTLSAGQFADFGSLAMLSASDGWVLGQKIVGDASGNTTHVPLKQLLYYYSNGQWRDVSPHLDGDGWFTLERIVMRSASDGWIVGTQQNAYPGATVSDYQQHTVLLHYQGGQWQQVQAPNTGTPVDAITGLAFSSNGTGWAAGYVSNIPASDTVQDTDVLAKASPELWIYQGGAWTVYHP